MEKWVNMAGCSLVGWVGAALLLYGCAGPQPHPAAQADAAVMGVPPIEAAPAPPPPPAPVAYEALRTTGARIGATREPLAEVVSELSVMAPSHYMAAYAVPAGRPANAA